MKRLTILASLAFCSSMAFAQTQVSDYRPGLTEEGITYFLPSTCVRVAITAKKVHHKPGEFCQFAERFLRLKNVAQTEYDEWTIQQVNLSSYGVADKQKAYTVKLKAKTSAPFVGLSEDGRLLSINTEAPQEKELVKPSVVKEKASSVDPSSFKTQEILHAGSSSKMAELTANEIYDIRENRALLSKGQADFMPKDGEQLRLMLANLDEQEEGLLKLFTGTTTTETHTFVLDLQPKGETEKMLLFRFSKYLGIVANDDPAGVPYYVEIKDLHTLPETTVDPQMKPKKKVEDVRYAIPGRVNVRVFNDTDEFVSQSFPMAQFGKVEHLGGELFNKKNTTRITFYPETGGIQKLEGDVQ